MVQLPAYRVMLRPLTLTLTPLLLGGTDICVFRPGVEGYSIDFRPIIAINTSHNVVTCLTSIARTEEVRLCASEVISSK